MSTADESTTTTVDLSTIFQKQRAIALAVASHDGTANASEINQAVEFGANHIRHHAKQLIKKGLLRETGRRIDTGPGADAVEYELTELGKTSVSRYRGLAEGITTDARLDVLEANYRELQRDHEELEERFERLLERLAEG